MSLEEIKQKKLEELKEQLLQQQMNQQLQQQVQEQAQLEQQIQQLELFVKQRLTKKALERFGNIKFAHPELAMNLTAILAELIQRNNLNVVDDDQLKNLLMRLQPKQGFTLERK